MSRLVPPLAPCFFSFKRRRDHFRNTHGEVTKENEGLIKNKTDAFVSSIVPLILVNSLIIIYELVLG